MKIGLVHKPYWFMALPLRHSGGIKPHFHIVRGKLYGCIMAAFGCVSRNEVCMVWMKKQRIHRCFFLSRMWII